MTDWSTSDPGEAKYGLRQEAQTSTIFTGTN